MIILSMRRTTYVGIGLILSLTVSGVQAKPAKGGEDRNATVPTETCAVTPVDQLIREGKIPSAYALAQTLYQRCPDPVHRRLYAKLAFWNKEIDTAYRLIDAFDPKEKLYRQIYAAKIIRDLKHGGHPAIPKFLETDYDVLAARIEAEIRRGNFPRAYRLSRTLYNRYRTKEALEYQANLLLWMKRYPESLERFQKLGDRKRVREIRKIMLEEKLARTDRRITEAWQHSDKRRARETFERLDPAEKDLYRRRYRDNACRVESTRMLGIGFDHVSYSDHRYRDHTNYLEFTLPIERTTIYGKLEDTDRYGLHDTRLSLEIYPPGVGEYWGYISLSVTPDADFYSHYSVGANLYRDFGSEEIGIGYLYSHYDLQESHLAHLEYTHFFSDYLSLKGAYYYEFLSRSYALQAEARYATPCHLEIKATYVYSSSNELLTDSRILQERGHNLQLELEYPLTRHLSVGGRLLWQQSLENTRYTTRGASLFFRSYW